MKSGLRKTVLVAATIFVIIQFVQPVRNESGQVLDKDISKSIVVPVSVQIILTKSCYDCHSNNTHYPWYAKIQPGAWFMDSHIRNGKEKLNFSEFGTYSKRRQESKLDGIGRQIKDGNMPLPSYLLLHRNAVLSRLEKEALTLWANSSKDSLSSKN